MGITKENWKKMGQKRKTECTDKLSASDDIKMQYVRIWHKFTFFMLMTSMPKWARWSARSGSTTMSSSGYEYTSANTYHKTSAHIRFYVQLLCFISVIVGYQTNDQRTMVFHSLLDRYQAVTTWTGNSAERYLNQIAITMTPTQVKSAFST